MNDQIIFGAVLCEILALAANGCSFSGTGAGAIVDASFFEADGAPSTTPSHDSGATQHMDAGRSTDSTDGAKTPD